MLVKQLSFYGILNRNINKIASEKIIDKFDNNARYIRFRAIGCLEKAGFNANHDGFPYSEFEDDRFGYGYKSFIGKNAHVEHNSHEGVTGKIGEIIDAYLNRFKLPEDYKSWKELSGFDKWKLRKEILEMDGQRLGDIEALMKIDLNLLNSNIISNSTKEKLKRIVNNLDSGKMLFCSMGCNADYSVCTVCGNIAKYEKDYCEHIKTKLRGTQYMTTANSIRDLLQKDLIRPEFLPFFVYSKYDINEILNGYSNRGVVVKAAEINYGIQFFELSVVSNPAFSAAVMIEKIASTVI